MSQKRLSLLTVTAQRGKSPVRVLEVPDLGVVSQTRSLARAADEVREAIAFESGLDDSEFDLIVVPLLSDDASELKVRADELRRKADEAEKEAIQASLNVAAALKEQGYSIHNMGRILGVSHQRAADLAG